LRLGTSVAFFDAGYLKIYASIALGMIGLTLARAALTDSLVVLLVLTTVASAAVLWLNRRLLRIGQTFPELQRLPLAHRLFGD
jgi:hypothetical protein